jgi:hypothetical protein
LRNCTQCGAPDHEIKQLEADSVHFVVPEIRYLSRNEEFQPRMRLKGWVPKVFQGRPAMFRYMCRHCLNDNEVRDRVWAQLKKAAKQLEKKSDKDMDFYAVLCEA